MPRTAHRIFRRAGSPFWQASWTDAEGEPHRESTGCRDRRHAEAWLATRELERVQAQAGVPVARSVALPDAAAEYLAEKVPPVWAPKWWQTAEGMFRLQVVPAFGERPVSSLTDADAAKFRAAQLQRTVRGGRVVSPSTVNRTFWMLAAFGEWCIERQYHLANPWKVESLPETQNPPPAVDDATLARVLMSLSARWRPVVEFAAETGMRKGELGRLRWEDIAGDVAWIVSSHKRGLTKARKTRPVPLSRRALGVLEALPRRPDGCVFGPVGDPRRAFKRAAEAAGLGRVWMHLFRHAAASRAAEAGASVAELQLLGGWSSARMAERYTHARLERLRDVLNRPRGDPTSEAKGRGRGRKT
jgi:integrase